MTIPGHCPASGVPTLAAASLPIAPLARRSFPAGLFTRVTDFLLQCHCNYTAEVGRNQVLPRVWRVMQKPRRQAHHDRISLPISLSGNKQAVVAYRASSRSSDLTSKNVCRIVPVVISVGRLRALRKQVVELAGNHAVDTVHPDVLSTGGILEAKKTNGPLWRCKRTTHAPMSPVTRRDVACSILLLREPAVDYCASRRGFVFQGAPLSL